MATLLIVDDSATFREQLRGFAEKAGHQVIEAADGLLGLESLRSHPSIDLILLDVNMPNLDGLSMCRRIHEDPQLQGRFRIFLVTTEANPEMKNLGKQYGVLAWVTKPVQEKKILAAIEKVLSQQNPAITTRPTE